MSYVVFARKWRPKTLTDVVGQETVTRTLRNALSSGRIGQAFLLTGARGVGKTSTARILAAALNCSSTPGPTPDPCGTCASCTEIAAGTSVDVQEIDGASNNSVEDVRELRESTRFNPARDRYRIWIIDEVHMLSAGAFNALLKTLEEPPPKVKFILATTEMKKLPETILSRCQIHAFRLIPARDLATHLRSIASSENIEISDSALLRIARAAEGSVRDALSLFDQVYAFTGARIQDEDVAKLLGLIDRELLREATRAVFENDSAGVLRVIETLASYGADYEVFSHELLLYWRDLLVLKISPDSDGVDLLPEDRAAAAQFVTSIPEEDLLRLVDSLSRSELDFRKAIDPDPRLSLEMALLKAAQLRRLVSFADLVSRVEQFLGESPRAIQAAPPERPRALPPVSTPAHSTSRLTPPPEVAAPPTPPPVIKAEPPAPAEKPNDSRSAIDRLREAITSRMLQAALSSASATVEDDAIHLSVAETQLAFLESERDTLAGTTQKAFGRKLRVVLKAGQPDEVDDSAAVRSRPARPALEAAPAPAKTPPAAPPASGKAAPNKAALKARAAADPVVERTLDLFGGILLDVKPLDTPAEAADDGAGEEG
ncbi:MAG: DNA polymerase III subunit gamma/tau [Vicinamibacteria bacterium]|nr:DNA polymerase III subunit gamma/tau [Vicinamibacteria bacterium]